MQYSDYSPEDQKKLDDAWGQISAALDIYYEVTGAGFLDDAVYDTIWQCIEAAAISQK